MPQTLLSSPAREDLQAISDHSFEIHGTESRDRYFSLIQKSIRRIAEEQPLIGEQPYRDGIFSYHIGLAKKSSLVNSPRHLIFFQGVKNGEIHILRVLHDSMYFRRHL